VQHVIFIQSHEFKVRQNLRHFIGWKIEQDFVVDAVAVRIRIRHFRRATIVLTQKLLWHKGGNRLISQETVTRRARRN